MKSLSVCVIAKNEEKFLERSLSSIQSVADEFIFVDTGSKDRTVEIAKKFTKNIHYFKWVDDFSAAYNAATDQATKDYIFRWDADYYAPIETISVIKDLKSKNFFSKNIIAGRWVDIDSDSLLPTGFVMRDMIYQKGQFSSSSAIHSFIKPSQGVKTDRVELEDFVIEHRKHKLEKNFRYTQSYNIIRESLRNNPDNPYLRFHLILAYMYSEEFESANQEIERFLNDYPDYFDYKNITLIEKKIACMIQMDKITELPALVEEYRNKYQNNPLYLLVEADVLALTDPDMAKKKYLKFISNSTIKSLDGPYLYSRYRVHPYIMLAKLETNPNIAEKYKEKATNLNKKYSH